MNAMPRTGLLGAAAAAAVLSAMPAHAQVPGTGLYAGGGIGRYGIRITDAADLGNVIRHYSATDTAFKLFAGMRVLPPFLAVEAAYVNLGSNSQRLAPGLLVSHRIDGFEPSLVGTLPIGPIELFVHAGEYWYHYARTYRTPFGVLQSASDTYHHFTYGAGLGAVFLRELDVRLDYEELKIQQTSSSNALWLTAALRF